MSHQRIPDGALHGGKNAVLGTKTDFPLGRMRVDIHLLRRQVNVDNRHRITAVGQLPPIRLLHRVGNGALINPPPVDQQGNVGAVAPGQLRRRRVAADDDVAGGVVQRQHQPGNIRPVHGEDGILQAAGAGGTELLPVVNGQRKAHGRMR